MAMLFVGSYRIQQILGLKSKLNFRLNELNLREMDLQSYSSSIADNSISINDLMNVPASMFNRMSIFMNYSHQSAMAGVQQKIGPMMTMAQANGIFTNMPAQYQQQYQQMLFNSLYEQERKNFTDNERNILNEEEKKIEQEKAQIQTQLQMLDAEQKTTQEAVDQAAKDSAPKFVA